jgi:hypothetical protein
VILERFGLAGEPPARVKEIDRALLATEKLALTASGWDWPELQGVEPVGVTIEPWPPARGTREYRRRFDAIRPESDRAARFAG